MNEAFIKSRMRKIKCIEGNVKLSNAFHFFLRLLIILSTFYLLKCLLRIKWVKIKLNLIKKLLNYFEKLLKIQVLKNIVRLTWNSEDKVFFSVG